MDLSRALVKDFANMANNKNVKEKPSIHVRGTVKMVGDKKFVQLDGSDALTPLTETVDVRDKDRVLVAIENHTATVLGNYSFPPSARKEQEAVDKAENAQTSANNAVNKAEDAQNSATDAGNKAQQAGNKADQAMQQAGAVEGLANDAKQNAQQAIDAANKAEQNAADAKQSATNADLNAQTARGEAEKAQQAAANAQGEVTKINKEVDAVKGDINTALTELGNQAADLQATKETLELNYAKKTDVSTVEANLKTEISKKVGELQTTVEQNYAAKTDIVNMEGKLQSQITQNAQGLTSQSSKVEKLESDTTEARKQVDIALEKAASAQSSADKAQTDASLAQTAADLAKQNATTAASKAEAAKTAADAANAAASAADAKVQSAQADLNEAKQNLTNVSNRVGATEQEIADAQAKVDAAQQSVNKALADAAEASTAATNAQNAANKAQTDAANAQLDATNAQKKADNATLAADKAQQAADQAQKDVAALTSRVTTAETQIKQNSDAITLSASKIEEIGKRNNVIETTVYWYLSQSATELVGGTWVEGTVPAWKDGSYYWQKVLTKYFDGSTKESSPVCLTGPSGKPGQDGTDGQNGTDGKGVKNIVNYYLATSSGSGVTDATSGWTTTVQTISASKKYLWNYELVTYTDDSTSKTVPCIIGAYGDKGTTGDTGATGVGISSIVEYYQISSSNSTAPTTWLTTVPTLTVTNRYLWNYEKITYTDETTKETAKRVIGVYGDKGSTGATGQGIESITVEYYLSTSKTTQIGGSWTTTMPVWKTDTYLWIRNKLVYKNPSSTTYTTPYCDSSWEAAKDVADDLKNNYYNKTQTDAKFKIEADKISSTVSKVEVIEKTAIKSTVEEFYLSTSPTVLTGGTWSNTQPTWTPGKYIWRRTLVTKGDGTTSYTPSQNGVCITGNTGPSGPQGLQGIQGPQGQTGLQGPAGTDGKTTYFHIKYSSVSNPTTSSQMTETPSTYIGTYVDFIQTDSTDPSKYTWSRFVGAQGAKGDQGIAGKNGVNGQTSYLHIAYATNSTGTEGFSVTDSTNKTYIGQYTDFVLSDSTNPSKYSWSKIQGPTGENGTDFSNGTMLYTDPTFMDGTNGTSKYANVGGEYLTYVRSSKSADNPFDNTEYEMVVTNTGAVNPPNGGFSFSTMTRANAVFVYRVVAKIPVGRDLCFATNANGDGGIYKWLTSNAGTGKFTEYIVKVICGASGSFSGTGYFYVNGAAGTSMYPLKWYIAYATCFDMTSSSDSLYAKETADAGKETADEALSKATSNETIITKSMTQIEQLDDQISALVTDEKGNSLMVQDSSGWHFNIGAIQNKLNNAVTDLSGLTGDMKDAQTLLDATKGMADALEKKTAFIDMTMVDGKPAIILGQSNSRFKLRITNTSIDFLDGTEAVAYISNQNLYITRAIIKDEIQIGDGSGWIWKKRPNGNLGLRWIG